MIRDRRPGTPGSRAVSPSAPGRVRKVTGTPGHPGSWAAAASAALVFALTWALVRSHGFVWDDLDLVARDPAVRRFDLVALLSGDFARAAGGGSGFWRPLVSLSLAFDHAMGGGSPAPFHFTNAIVHALSACAAGWLVARFVPQPIPVALAVFVAGFTAVTSENAGWIAARTDSLVTLFGLAYLLADGSGRAAWRRGFAPLALLAALASKESAVLLPLVALAQRRVRPVSGARAADWIPIAAVMLAMLAAHARFADPVRTLAEADRWRQALGVPALLGAHLALLVPGVVPSAWREWAPPVGLLVAGGAATLAVLGWASTLAWRRRSAALVALALMVLPLVPATAGTLIEGRARWADRFVHTSAAGFGLLFALGVSAAAARPRTRWFPVLAAAWPLAHLAGYVPALGDWASDESRLRRLATREHRGVDARLGFADWLAEHGRLADADEWIARAALAEPDAADVHAARAAQALRRGDAAAALAASERALQADPRSLAGGALRVMALRASGRGDAALVAAESLRAAHPGVPRVESLRAEALLATGRNAEALVAWRAVARAQPADAGAAFAHGVAAARTNALDEACEALARATALDPSRIEAWLLLAGAEARRGRPDEARAALDGARRQPDGAARADAMARELGLAP